MDKSVDSKLEQLGVLVNEANKKGLTLDDRIAQYNQRPSYYVTVAVNHYNGPKQAATFVQQYLGDQLDSKILDIAAGAGSVGFELNKLGFTNLHALDPAVEYFEKSPHKALYQSHVAAILGEKKTDIRDGDYDAIVISGGFAEGHLPCSALPEMIRIVKPGGYIINVMHEQYLTEVEEYAGKLEPYMKKLEDEGKWKLLERSVVEKYWHESNGVVHVFLTTKR